MARTSTYLNFMGQTEAAFEFYKTVFRTEYFGPLRRMGDMAGPGGSTLPEAEQRLVLHVELPIVGGHMLMGSDGLESMGHTITMGTNVSINLEPDTREETARLFNALVEGGRVIMPLGDMFWGAYFGAVEDRFGVRWMVNCSAARPS